MPIPKKRVHSYVSKLSNNIQHSTRNSLDIAALKSTVASAFAPSSNHPEACLEVVQVVQVVQARVQAQHYELVKAQT
jgi:hypothetical protein